MGAKTSTNKLFSIRQLNFSLLALHNDPIPDLQKQLAEVQMSGNAALAAEISAKLDRENHKRQQWAVSLESLVSANVAI